MSDDRMTNEGDRHGIDPADVEREFGRRGWFLVGLVVVSFIVVPAIVLLHPPGYVPFRVAFLVLPLLPAILLGIVAVWATTRP